MVDSAVVLAGIIVGLVEGVDWGEAVGLVEGVDWGEVEEAEITQKKTTLSPTATKKN